MTLYIYVWCLCYIVNNFMYLYDWQTGALYCDMSNQVPLFYVPVYQPPLLQP